MEKNRRIDIVIEMKKSWNFERGRNSILKAKTKSWKVILVLFC
jgi:hypothetical protein